MWWLGKDPSKDFTESIPGMDNRSDSSAVSEVVEIGAHFESFEQEMLLFGESWPRFRGVNFDNISQSPIALIDQFPSGGPKVLWSKDLGEGHAGAAIYEGMGFLLDYDEDNRADVLRCFRLQDGVELWKRWYNLNLKRNHGMSRTVPAVNENYVLTIGPKCHLMCVDRKSGDFLWGKDIEKEYESEIPFWYTGQCPLIDGEEAIIATGGKALMIGLDMETGEKLWETPNPGGWKMSHSSIMPFEFAGVKMYVYSAVGGVAGIAATGPEKGKLLWKNNAWNHSVVAPSPVCMPDGKIFLTAGYGAGSMMLQLSKKGNSFEVKIHNQYAPKEGLACEQQTPILWNGHLFGILPKDAGPFRNQFVCVHPDDVQKTIWSSDKTARFGLGPYMMADNKIFIMDDHAVLTIIRPSIREYVQLDQVKLFEGHDAWAPFALADGLLLLRDSKKMICLDIRK